MIFTQYTLEDYINAPSGIGPLAFTWCDKPHRFVYDLVMEIKNLEERLVKTCPINQHI